MTQYTIVALGQAVTYDPEQVLSNLRVEYAHLCSREESLSAQEIILTTFLYAKLEHTLSPAQVGGILACFRQGVHVSNVLLRAAQLIK
jgi:hypothetical protein